MHRSIGVPLSTLFLCLALLACSLNTALSTPAQSPSATLPPTASLTPSTESLTSPNFRLGARVTRSLTPAQIAFLNRNFYDVMTPYLSEEVRQTIRQPQLFLYRSIQGTWEGFTQFDWAHIDAHESMFLHHDGRRIRTIWNSWLMNPGDFVDEDTPDALDHWINYYAITAAAQVHDYGYDGLFIDSASHWLNPHAVNGVMPDDYDLGRWHDDRVRALRYIKMQLPDKVVIFNGLHNQHGAEDSLAYTDGGMWETFAFRPRKGDYLGEASWQAAIELTERHPDKFIALIVKEQPNLNTDIAKRLFAVGSYLLVSRDKVVFSMTDAEHPNSHALLYYPEYTLDLGAPLAAYSRTEAGLYLRRFERGMVIVNPSADRTLTCTVPDGSFRVIPVGGGEVGPEGDWEGSLTYRPISGEVALPPVSALLLVDRQP